VVQPVSTVSTTMAPISKNNKSTTGGAIDNPFKEERVPWSRYGILLGVAFLLTVIFVVSDDRKVRAHQGHFQPNLLHGNSMHHGHTHSNPHRPRQHGTVEFPEDLSVEDYPTWLHNYQKKLDWSLLLDDDVKHAQLQVNMQGKGLTQTVLQTSLDTGCQNLVANQKDGLGNFNYQYDFVKQELDTSDSQVRNVGAFWGLTLCHQHYVMTSDNQNEKSEFVTKLEQGIEKALKFFLGTLIEGPVDGSFLVQYPDSDGDLAHVSETGTNAILGLALIDYIRTLEYAGSVDSYDGQAQTFRLVQELKPKLRGIVEFILYMQMPNLHFAQEYLIAPRPHKVPSYSNYFDGESLLCLVKAAKYIKGYDHLIPLIEETAPALAKAYTVDVWPNEHDSPVTKGFYQWSSMAFAEYFHAGWEDADVMGDYVLALGHWIVHTHRILIRQRNTGYAFEGIVSAYQVALARNLPEIAATLQKVVQVGLYKITKWQVGGPLAAENPYLVQHPTTESIAVGGIMNARNEAPLRIDTTQHQMHAVMMALEQKLYTTEAEA